MSGHMARMERSPENVDSKKFRRAYHRGKRLILSAFALDKIWRIFRLNFFFLIKESAAALIAD